MSIANLLVPNNFNIYSNSLSMNLNATEPPSVNPNNTLWLNSVNNHLYRDNKDLENQNPGPAPNATADLYVSVAGSDVTGTGSIVNPYLTITHAINNTFIAGPTQQCVVHVGAGTWNESFTCKPYVTIMGDGEDNTILGGIIDFNSPLFNNGNLNLVQFQNLSFAPSVVNTGLMSFDLVTPGAINTEVEFWNCYVNTLLFTISGGIGNTINIYNSTLKGNQLVLIGVNSNFISSLNGDFALNAPNNMVCNLYNSSIGVDNKTTFDTGGPIVTVNAFNSCLGIDLHSSPVAGGSVIFNLSETTLPSSLILPQLFPGTTFNYVNGLLAWTDIAFDGNVVVGQGYDVGFTGAGNTVLGAGNLGGGQLTGNNNTVVGSACVPQSTNSGNTLLGALTSSTNDNCICLGVGASSSVPNQLVVGSIGTPINTALTVGAAGPANALPAQPETYLLIRLNGVALQIPCYLP